MENNTENKRSFEFGRMEGFYFELKTNDKARILDAMNPFLDSEERVQIELQKHDNTYRVEIIVANEEPPVEEIR